jgi:adenosylcobinamide-GDP ribazoletransferase
VNRFVGRILIEWRTLLEALRFFTRLPLGYAPHDADLLARSHPCFPIVGAAVGVILILAFNLVEPTLGRGLAVLVMLAVGWVLTGGFHEDGFADVCDGIWGGFTPERRLEIMKDSRVGTFGSLGLIWLVAMKATALGQIEPALFGSAVFLSHVIARASAVLMLAVFPTARSDGGGRSSLFVGPPTWSGGAATLVVTLLLTLWLPCGLAGVVVTTAVSLLCGLWFLRTLGGINGDTLGATNQLSELAVMLCFVVVSTPAA